MKCVLSEVSFLAYMHFFVHPCISRQLILHIFLIICDLFCYLVLF